MSGPETDSRALLARAGGDPGAVEALLCMHLPALTAYVRLRAGPMLRARESASDIVQSACREVLEHADRFRYRDEAGFRAWLYTTAMRKIADRADHWRAAKRDAAREQGGEEALLQCYRSVCTPSQEAVGRETLAAIEAAFDRLDDDHREVILLARIVGLTRAEIGERMGRSEVAVRSLLHRALAELVERLHEAG